MIIKHLVKTMLSILGLCVLIGVAQADNQVTLAWDPNDPAPEGYRLFVREINGAYDYTSTAWEVPAGTETITVTGLTEGVTYAFVVRAFVGADTSGDSNEVVYTPQAPPQQIVIPQRVNGIRIVFE